MSGPAGEDVLAQRNGGDTDAKPPAPSNGRRLAGAVQEAQSQPDRRSRPLEDLEAQPFASPARGGSSFRRSDVYGEQGTALSRDRIARMRAWMRDAPRGGAQEEAELDAALQASPRVTRTNTIAVVSPKGGVGKTTCTFLLGDLIAASRKLRVLAVDANRDFGTLASLAPDALRVERSLADLLMDLDRVKTASELGAYVSPLPSGLHVLGAPERAELMAEMTPELYGELLDFLSHFYDIILLDLGTGIIDPLAQFGIRRADQAIIVTTPEYVTADKVLGALRYMHDTDARRALDSSERLIVALNGVTRNDANDRAVIEAAFRRQGVKRHVTIPHDQRLRHMLDSATYDLERLPRGVRLAVKRLGLSVAEKLV